MNLTVVEIAAKEPKERRETGFVGMPARPGSRRVAQMEYRSLSLPAHFRCARCVFLWPIEPPLSE